MHIEKKLHGRLVSSKFFGNRVWGRENGLCAIKTHNSINYRELLEILSAIPFQRRNKLSDCCSATFRARTGEMKLCFKPWGSELLLCCSVLHAPKVCEFRGVAFFSSFQSLKRTKLNRFPYVKKSSSLTHEKCNFFESFRWKMQLSFVAKLTPENIPRWN